MIRKFAALVVVASMTALAPPMAAGQEAPAIAASLPVEVRDAAQVVDAFHAALARNDAKAAAALLTQDALIFEGGHVERSKAEYASHHAAADAAYASAVPSSVLRRSGGANGDIVWIASESRTVGTYKDKPVDRLTTETMVLKRSGDGWAIAHIHWSSRPSS